MRYGPYDYNASTSNGYYTISREVRAAVCNGWYATVGFDNWAEQNTCPKGWGKNKWHHSDDRYTVQYAQGYVNDNSKPIYSTVTKYRDTVYNYTAGRIAKA